MKSPFQFGKIASPARFINREKETARLISNLNSGINTILISPRRWGKSSLVAQCAHVSNRRNKKIKFVFIDLFNIRSEELFYETLARQVVRASSTKWEERMKTISQFFKQVVPKVSFNPSPNVDLGLSFQLDDLKRHPYEVLDLAENLAKSKGIEIVVCVDEFQNITYFKDPLGFQKVLRSYWQKHQYVTYFIYGSKRSMMTELFEKSKNPFFKFGDVVLLQKIEQKHWLKYLPEAFASTKRKITEANAQLIIDLMDNHPYFIQQLAHEVWNRTTRYATAEIIHETLLEMYSSMSILYQKEVDLLSTPQVNFLKAVVDGVERFTTLETLHKYDLGSSSNIKRIKTALESKEVIDLMEPKIDFVDPLFKLWFKNVYIPLRN